MMAPSQENLFELELRFRALVGLRPPVSDTAYRLVLLSLRAPSEPWWMVRKWAEP
jgi:hypothetical protein